MHPILRRSVPGIALAFIVSVSLAATTHVERSKPVVSPDGRHTFTIDHISAVVDGEVERFSGRLLLRVSDAEGTTTRQRYVEASQVRVLNPAVWLDNRWCAFTYNISKNSSGYVCMDAQSGEAMLLEMVATSRRMGATGKQEVEITDVEVTAYGDSVVRISNAMRGNRPVFPLYLPALQPIDAAPYPVAFAESLRGAIDAYAGFCRKHGVQALRLEQASESFDPTESHMAVLACSGKAPYLVIVPLKDTSAGDALAHAVLGKLGDEVRLACSIELADEDEENTADKPAKDEEEDTGEQFGPVRYTTKWQDNTHVAVEQEVFENEDETGRSETLLIVGIDGKVEKVKPAAKPAEGGDTAKPDKSSESE